MNHKKDIALKTKDHPNPCITGFRYYPAYIPEPMGISFTESLGTEYEQTVTIQDRTPEEKQRIKDVISLCRSITWQELEKMKIETE